MLNHKGQSATEMAIFGTLIIAAFSFIIMFSERINRQQSYIMQGFRESLKEARSLKGPVSYTKYADRRMPNVSTPMALGNQETFSTNSNVMWGNQFGISSSNTLGLAATELSKSYTYIKLNDAPLIEVPDIATPAAGTIATEVTTTTQQTHTENDQVLTKSAGVNSVSTKTLTVTDKLTEVSPDYNKTFYLGQDGKYYVDSSSKLIRTSAIGN